MVKHPQEKAINGSILDSSPLAASTTWNTKSK
jgi:hypothetical protein